MIRRFLQAVFIVLLAACTAVAGDWPRFRGPNGSGLSDSVIPAEWTDANRLWKIALPGSGHGSPVVWNDRVFLLCGDESTGRRTALCVSAGDGATLWKHDAPGAAYHHHRFNSVASSTPAVDAERVYFTWGSPDKITAAAFRHDGTPVWEAGATAQVIVSSWRLGLTGVEAATGRQLWQKPVYGARQERAIASPFIAEDFVIGNCGFAGRDKHVVVLHPGKGADMEEAWRVEKSAPHIPSPIVVKDRMFLWNDQGVITCVKLATGEPVWSERVPGEFFASPVCAAGRLFGVDKTGVVTVVAVADKFQLLARNPLEEASQATPAIADGRMFIRTVEHLHCIGVRVPQPPN